MDSLQPNLDIVPVDFEEAKTFVNRHHRHHGSPVGHKFSIGCVRLDTGEICGVIMVGRPVARMLDNGLTLEVNRCCTDGTPNACSKLYAAARRTAFGWGYKKLITYTLPSEGGASLRGAGFKCLGAAGGDSWNRKNRPRIDTAPLQTKLRWESDIVPVAAESEALNAG